MAIPVRLRRTALLAALPLAVGLAAVSLPASETSESPRLRATHDDEARAKNVPSPTPVRDLSRIPGSSGISDRIRTLRNRLSRILTATGWRSAEWSVLAVSLDVGDTLYARGAGEARIPASNVKLLTTAAALHHLGPDFRYQTFVLADGPVVDGRLEGDLILYGTGDPGLSERFHDSRTAVFRELATELRRAGIVSVEGDVVGDGTFFGGPLLVESWDPRDLNDWFAAPVSALSFNENVVTLRIEPAESVGGRPVVHTIPEHADLPLENGARTGRGRIFVGRDHPGEPIRVEGAVPTWGRDVWRRITVADPARFVARIFTNVLEEEGVTVDGGVRTVRTSAGSALTGRRLWAPGRGRPGPRILARHTSPPLRAYLEVVNKESHNLLAELTLKTLGRVVDGDGSFDGGVRVVRRFLTDQVGVDGGDLHLVDGSGLSVENRATTRVFTDVLTYLARSDLWDVFWETLPEAGNRRELRRMYRTAAARNLRAKTGTIERVSALSGMVRSANGERIVFSILGNDLPSTWTAKRVEDRIGARLASFRRPFRDVLRRRASGNDRASDRAPTSEVGDNRPAVPGLSDDGPDPDPRPLRHQVGRGESFALIARRYGVSLGALLEANPGISPRRLPSGEWIRIPRRVGGGGEG